MQELLDFARQNWLLFSAGFVILVLLIMEETRSKVKGVNKISPPQLVQLYNHENAVIVDVRSKDAFTAGHITGAINIPEAELNDSIRKIEKYTEKPLIIVCDSGQKSITVGAKLVKRGFQKVNSLDGGMAAWKKAGMPLAKK